MFDERPQKIPHETLVIPILMPSRMRFPCPVMGWMHFTASMSTWWSLYTNLCWCPPATYCCRFQTEADHKVFHQRSPFCYLLNRPPAIVNLSCERSSIQQPRERTLFSHSTDDGERPPANLSEVYTDSAAISILFGPYSHRPRPSNSPGLESQRRVKKFLSSLQSTEITYQHQFPCRLNARTNPHTRTLSV